MQDTLRQAGWKQKASNNNEAAVKNLKSKM